MSVQVIYVSVTFLAVHVITINPMVAEKSVSPTSYVRAFLFVYKVCRKLKTASCD